MIQNLYFHLNNYRINKCKKKKKIVGVKQWEMFAAMLLFRPYRGTVGLGQRASSADRRKTA